MRLARQSLAEITQLRPKRTDSDYVGTKTEYVNHAILKGHVTPTKDSYSIATYGERVNRMYTVLFEYGTDVINGDRLVINGEDCTVVSKLTYSSHIAVIAERDGINGYSGIGAKWSCE